MLDPFIRTMIFGRNGVPAEELLGPANTQKLVDAANYVFAITIAQLLNTNYRRDVDANLPTFNGSLVDSHHVRLVQSAISTRILQGLLGVMFLCAAIPFASIHTRRVLPKNPCSIAAVWSMLAASRMLSEDFIPKGSEWCSDKELRERGVFEGHSFTLGWWDSDGNEGHKRFGIDIDSTTRERDREK